MAYYQLGPDSEHLSTAEALFGSTPKSFYGDGGERIETAAGSVRWIGFARSIWVFSAIPVATLDAARQTLFSGDVDSGVGYVETRDVADDNVASPCIIRFPNSRELERWGGYYTGVTIELILTETDAVIQWGEGLVADYVTESELTEAIATHTADDDAHHDPVTLSTEADTVLELNTQEIDLDTQVANTVLAGPASGADAKPTARTLVDADIPSGIARDTEVTNEIALHAAIDDAHHDPVTLAGGSDPALSLSTQELSLRAATDTQTGVVKLSTETEAKAHTSTSVALTPSSLAGIIQLDTPASDGGVIKSGSGTLTLAADGSYTLTAPATGTIALLGETQTFTGAKTFNDNVTIASGKWIGNASDGVRVLFDNTTDSERLEIEVASLIQFDGYRTPSYAASETGVILRGPNARSIFVELRNNDADDRFSVVVDPDNTGGADKEALSVTGDGRIGFNAPDPIDLIELHIKAGESGGITISRDTSDLVAELYQSGGGNSVGVFKLYSSNTANVQLNAYSGGVSFVNNTLGVATTSPSISDGKGVHVGGAIIRLDTSKTPASASATGNQGEVCWDSSYIYVCTATNTWKRVAIATW